MTPGFLGAAVLVPSAIDPNTASHLLGLDAIRTSRPAR
jgi:hypothetical protein